MNLRRFITPIVGLAMLIAPSLAGAQNALTTSCVGVPTSNSINWTASSSGGVPPVNFQWGNLSTAISQTIAETPGTYTMSLTATDASTSVATTTCTATVLAPLSTPTISNFSANPPAIIVGQNSILSWSVANASTTSLDNGIGLVSGTSVTVAPSVTTTYVLSATNPNGTVTANTTVVVSATSTSGTTQSQILALIAQINALKNQILALLGSQGGGTATTTPPSKHGLCFDITRNLKKGDDGDDVKTLQQSLAQDPTIFPEGLITGHFGPATEKAVEKFQNKFGAGTTTGIFGPISRGLFRQFCGEIGNGKGNPHNPNSLQNQLNSTTTKHGDDNNQGNGKGKGNGDNQGNDD